MWREFVKWIYCRLWTMLQIGVCFELTRVWRVKAWVCQLFKVYQHEFANFKRPSHDKLKFANSCWQTLKSWQTHAFTRQTRVNSKHTPICNMADIVQWHSQRRVAACVLLLFCVKRRRKNRKRWRKRLIWTKPYISRNPSLGVYNTLVQERWNVPNSRIIVYFFNKFERRIAIFVRHLVKCHANHMTKARILIGWKIATHICQSFTRQIRVCQHEKVGEKVGENRDKFYLSPTVCQHVCQLFLCRSHTPTWVCQHEFANLKRPSHDKLKFANSCWQTLKSWQTHAFTRQTRVNSKHISFSLLLL